MPDFAIADKARGRAGRARGRRGRRHWIRWIHEQSHEKRLC